MAAPPVSSQLPALHLLCHDLNNAGCLWEWIPAANSVNKICKFHRWGIGTENLAESSLGSVGL